MKSKILFVCSGNICRSPLAEGLLKYYIINSDILNENDFKISSAGTLDIGQMPVSEKSATVASEYGAEINAHISKHIDRESAEEAEKIIVMSKKHKDYIENAFPSSAGKIEFLSNFGNPSSNKNIPDPIGEDLDYYRKIGKIIEDHIRHLVSNLEKEYTDEK
ncbi:MAG: hypothetical protein ACLFSQ_10590 [Candidatus Zixiibacteriota bacterium]